MLKSDVFVPLVTPFADSGHVCTASVARLIATSRHTASGYIPCLTSGEGWRLNESQWEAMVHATVAVAGGLRVVAGAERSTTDEVIDLAARATRLGATGLMCTAPFTDGVDQHGIFEHFRQIHERCGLELYVYNESALSGKQTAFETLLAIAELPRVVGIKDSPSKPRAVAEISALRRQGLAYYVGWECMLALEAGVDGNVVSLANLEPALCKLAIHSHAAALRAELSHLTEVYGLLAPDWYRHVKRALQTRGVIGTARLAGAEG